MTADNIVDAEVVGETRELTKPRTKADDLADNLFEDIAPVSETSKYMKMLVFGNPGSGKTTFAASAPSPLIIDVDRGSVAVAASLHNGDVMKFTSINKLKALIELLKRGHERFEKYETIIIDTLSEVHKRGLTEIAMRESKQGIRTNEYLNEGADHQENNERIRRIVSDLRDLDKHIVVNCHTKRIMSSDSGVSRFMPDFSEKLVNTCNAVFDIQAFLTEESTMDDQTYRKMIVRSGAHEVKTRINTLPNSMSDPTWTKVYAKYQEFVNADS